MSFFQRLSSTELVAALKTDLDLFSQLDLQVSIDSSTSQLVKLDPRDEVGASKIHQQRHRLSLALGQKAATEQLLSEADGKLARIGAHSLVAETPPRETRVAISRLCKQMSKLHKANQKVLSLEP